MEALILVLLAILPALVIVAGLKDLTSMTIPNWISGGLILGFVPAALAVGLPIGVVAIHFGIGLLALVCGAAMFAMKWIGGGDAKLMAAACLWLGLSAAGPFLLYTGVIGGAFCLILLGARGHLAPYLPTGPQWMARLMEPKGDIPYGVAIALGALVAFPESALVTAYLAT